MARQRESTCITENKPFPKILRKLMADENKTQTELASFVGCTRQAISLYATGQSTPDIDILIKISQSFNNVSTDYLLGLTDVKTSDVEIKDICEYTGLTDKAIDVIGKRLTPELQETLSHIVESERFVDLLCGIAGVTTQKNLYSEYVCDKAQEIDFADEIHARDIIIRAALIDDAEIDDFNNVPVGTKLMIAKEYVDVLRYKLANIFERLINEVTYSKEFDINTFERIIQLINNKDDTSAYDTKILLLEKARDGFIQDWLRPSPRERIKNKRRLKEGTQNGKGEKLAATKTLSNG